MKDKCWSTGCSADALVSLGLRLAVGITLLILGVQKLFNLSGFAESVQGMMSWAGPLFWVVAILVMLAEVLIGLLLVLGYKTQIMFFKALILLVIINVGLVLNGHMDKVTPNFLWIIAAAIGIYASTGKCCKPMPEPAPTKKKTVKKKTTKRKRA